MSSVIDFYSGYEGEPELTFSRRDGSEQMHMWSGYFDPIMEAVELPQEGWTSLALQHNLGAGWRDGPWTIDDIAAAIEQLQGIDRRAIDRPYAPKVVEVLDTLIGLLERARKHDDGVVIEYD